MVVRDKDWYRHWFGNEYLTVYAHRDKQEAETLLDLIKENIPIDHHHLTLDLCCGQGRHALLLASQGFRVVGVDLSRTLLEIAKYHAGPSHGPKFVQADMRALPFLNEFDMLLNLFTSFGYFDSDQENQQVFGQFHRVLKTDGYFVFDYLNERHVVENLVEFQQDYVNNIGIQLERKIVEQRVEKEIKIEKQGKKAKFFESVKMYKPEEIFGMLAAEHLNIEKVFGDYSGIPFKKDTPPAVDLRKESENMMQNLHTILYNKFYYDFLRGGDVILKYLPAFTNKMLKDVAQNLPVGDSIHTQMKSVLTKQNKPSNSKKVMESLSRLAEPNSVIIVTGQQLGFLLTPIYTIYKAMTTVKLAEQMNSLNTGFNFVPVFWMETEDHDFEEIRHAGIWDRNMLPMKIPYKGKDQIHKSIRHYRFEENIDDTIAKTREVMLASEFTGNLFTQLHTYYQAGRSWSAATIDLFRGLFSETGLLTFEPGTAEVKDIGKPFFEKWFDQIEPVSNAFTEISRRIESDGYPAQVPDIPGKTFVHYEDENFQRQHIYHANGSYYLKDRPEKWEAQLLKNLLNNQPHRFSTAVISRPVFQSWLFPVAGYVAGPSEIAYWAQIKKIFDEMKVAFPVVYPRLSATLIEPKIERFISKHDADITSPALKMKDFIDHYFQKNQLDDQRFSLWRSTINKTFAEIRDYVNQVDPTLLPVAEKTGQRIESQVEQLENRLLQAVEQKEKTLLNHLEQIHASIFPLEQPQERFVSIVYYLNKFGPGFIGRLIDKLELDPTRHQVLAL